MDEIERSRFDDLLERVLASLPPRIRSLLDEAPLIVDDRPSAKVMQEFGLESADELCGLHSGIPLTRRSVNDAPEVPETIHLFREGIVAAAGGWCPWLDEEDQPAGGPKSIAHEIRITLLHEIGHHYGLDEDDLEELGYG